MMVINFFGFFAAHRFLQRNFFGCVCEGRSRSLSPHPRKGGVACFSQLQHKRLGGDPPVCFAENAIPRYLVQPPNPITVRPLSCRL
jgi:hypothetical protein